MDKSDETQVPVIQWSRHARINAILRGLTSGMRPPRPYSRVGLWPFGPPVPGEELRIASRSGTRGANSPLGRLAKSLFLKGQYNWCRRFLAGIPDPLPIVWNGIKGHRRLLALSAQERGLPVIFLEEAPLPGRITVDSQGVNFGCSLPRQAEFYAAWLRETGHDPTAWRGLLSQLTPRAAKGGAVGQDPALASLGEEPYLFCPLQVPRDSQLTIYGDWIPSVEAHIEALHAASRALPPGWHLRVKPHPSSPVNFADRLNALADDSFRTDPRTDTFQQVARSRGVITVNSSVGLQAFFHDKPVIVLGQAFYAFGGMAEKVDGPALLARLLGRPEALGFDPATRDAFMSYLDAEYYPAEAEVAAGRWRISDLRARDRRRDRILEKMVSRAGLEPTTN